MHLNNKYIGTYNKWIVINTGSRCQLVEISEDFDALIDRCGFNYPIREDDLSENRDKLIMQLGLLTETMAKLKKTLASKIDCEKTKLVDSVKSLWREVN